MALFGEGSFIAERTAYPEKYISDGTSGVLPDGTCVDYAPLQFLREIVVGYNDWDTSSNCMYSNATKSLDDLNGGISLWLRNFQATDVATMENAFNAAAFLATKAWMEHQNSVNTHTLTVSMDMGSDTQVPAISRAGMYFISILEAIFLPALFAVALYSAYQPRWTNQLDSFAMMRIGAAIGDRVPLRLGRRVENIDVLDDIPGWVGDSEPGAEIGELGVGARSGLRKNRRYQCYSGDHEPWPVEVKGRDEYMGVRMEELRKQLIDDDHRRRS